MSSFTNCPNCQTQFVVTKKQLNQYKGKVRCGHCLHVFDATLHLVDTSKESANKKSIALENTITELAPLEDNTTISATSSDIETMSAANESDLASTNPAENDWPLIADEFEHALDPTAIDTKIAKEETAFVESVDIEDDFTITETIDYSAINQEFGSTISEPTLEDNPLPAPHTGSLTDNSVFTSKKAKQKKSSFWIWLLAALILLVLAIAQSLYFLRDEIAIYYPNAKSTLVQTCEQIGCRINLPKKIEYIAIDDFELQEDTEYAGLMHLTSTLINQAGFIQAYPNLELTLTDADDQAKLRRTLKPSEYLPEGTIIESGIAPGEAVKIKLAITTQGENVEGYHAFVTY